MPIVISDPVTGLFVIGGADREDALLGLDTLIKGLGGEEAFSRSLAARRTQNLATRAEAARRRADMQAVLGTGEEAQ